MPSLSERLFGGRRGLNTSQFQRSPKASTLLREPLLRGSAQFSSVRLPRPGSPDWRGFLRRSTDNFRSLPNEVTVVLLIDFLNSYRSFGFRSVQYQYMVDEFGLSDIETASLLGVQSWLLVVFGMVGAVLVDSYGVRRTALASLFVAVVSRALLTFGRSRTSLLVALLGLAPFGEAVLSTGIYTVALKKLTTPATRGFAFGVQYGVFNLAGALADVAADLLRTQDLTVPRWVPLIGGDEWSGLRLHLLGTWFAVLASVAVAVPLLTDAVIVPLNDPASPLSPCSSAAATYASSPPAASFLEAKELEDLRAAATPQQRARGFVVRPDPRFGRRGALAPRPPASPPPPRMWSGAAAASARRAWASLWELLVLRAFWRALWCSVCLLLISKQWGDLDQILPAYLERSFGEGVPIYRIHSINTWVCMLGPSLAAALTSHLEAWQVMLPGLWVMALSPLPLVLAPGVSAAVAWVVLMSIGEVVWSPRQSAWVASLAPDGREGVFLALLSLKSLVTTIPSTAFNGILNSAYIPNCPACRDHLGHFCSAPRALTAAESAGTAARAAAACATGAMACVGKDFAPELSGANASSLACPDSCEACPGWTGDGATLWLIVLITSLSSPLMIALTLRFLRGPEGEQQLATPPSRPLLATDGGSPPAPHLDRRAQVAAVGAGAPSDDVRVRGFTPSKKPSNAKPASWSGRSHEAPM